MHSYLNDITQKEMSRKEFLTTLGLGLASVMGFSAILKILGHKGFTSSQSHGYGTSPYGK
jgi:hypothetical protein